MRAGLRRTLWLAALAMLIWSLGYGPLLPWSPVRPGFRMIAGQRVTLIYPEAWPLAPVLLEPDRLLEEAETFHHLRAKRAIHITICPDWPSAYRILPRLARKGIGAITLATGTAIYLLPTIDERRRDPVEFIRHELSHAVLHQNQNLRHALRFAEVQWLAEGLAVWFGRQKSYLSDEEFLRLAPTRDLAAFLDPDLRHRLPGPFDIRFGYTCWKRFNIFLEAPDPSRYWSFVHAAIADPQAWRPLFAARFGQSFDNAITAFAQQEAKEAAALPPAPVPPASESHTPRNQSPPQ